MKSKKQDVEKVRYWKAIIHQAARSGLSNGEFCRQRKLQDTSFAAIRLPATCWCSATGAATD